MKLSVFGWVSDRDVVELSINDDGFPATEISSLEDCSGVSEVGLHGKVSDLQVKIAELIVET